MRADRLLAELLLLQARGRLSAARLAAELEVSERTVYRDMEALSAAGVPVYTERGRHGGCALLPGYRTDVTGLTEARPGRCSCSPGAARRPAPRPTCARRCASCSPRCRQQHRPAAQAARERVVVDPRAWHQPAEDVPHLATVQEAVWQTRRLRLRYRSSDA